MARAAGGRVLLLVCLPQPLLELLVLAQQLLEVANVGEHAVLLALELLHVATALRAAGDAIGDVALEIKVDAVGAALGQGIAADLAHLRKR